MTAALVALLVGVVIGGAVVFGVTQTAIPNVGLFLGASNVQQSEVTVTGWDIATLSGTDIMQIDLSLFNSDTVIHTANWEVVFTDGTGAHTASGIQGGIAPGATDTVSFKDLDTPADLITLTTINFVVTND